MGKPSYAIIRKATWESIANWEAYLDVIIDKKCKWRNQYGCWGGMSGNDYT
jgi:hypothetical protein